MLMKIASFLRRNPTQKPSKTQTSVRTTFCRKYALSNENTKVISARNLTRNGTFDVELVFQMDKKLHRVEFDPKSTIWNLMKENFYLVVHRSRLTDEEEFFMNFAFAKSPFFKGLYVKSGSSYKKASVG